MIILDIFLLAIALSMDAFSVSIICGLRLNKKLLKKYFKIAFTFGIFQSLMTVLGYFSSLFIRDIIKLYSPWLIFFIFLFLGLKTLYESFYDKGKSSERCNCDNLSCILSLAVLTSLDAFLAGAAILLLETSLVFAANIIGIITFIVTLMGCYIGCSSGWYLKKKARILAATILLVLAIKSIIPILF